MILTIILFILILSVLVLVHEFGHFYTARRAGVKVEEFGFGIPPRIWGKKFGETLYSINLLPFGGFVRLMGEDVDTQEEIDAMRTHPESFIAKTPGQRAVIVTAGVFMNILLAIGLYYIFFIATNFTSLTFPKMFEFDFRFGNTVEFPNVVMGFAEESPAEDAGLAIGDSVLKVDEVPVPTNEAFKEQIATKAGKDTELTVVDARSLDKATRVVTVVPIYDSTSGNVVVGAYMGEAFSLTYSQPYQKILVGPMHTYNVTAYSIYALSQLVKSSFAERSLEPVSESVSGPVGIASVVGGILSDGRDTGLALIDLVALLSISLAFINILPLPALDGGRLAFIVAEKITGKRPSHAVEMTIHKVGMLFLLLLLVLVTIRDVSRIF